MVTSEERAAAIRQLSDQIGAVDFAEASPTPPRYSHGYEQAAVLSSFDPEDLQLDNAAVGQLLKDCLVIVRDEAVRYVLDPDVRRRVLRQLGSRESMARTLAEIPDRPVDAVQDTIGRILAGRPAVDPDAPVSRLRAGYQALSWFADIVPTEPPDEIRARIEAAGMLDRFHGLVGDNFSGRQGDLDALRAYVGLPTGPFAKVLRRWATFDEEPALVITGPGGIGKSTLLAKFILEHASQGQLPFSYVNFDSPTVTADDPRTLMMETVRQLALEYPAFSRTINQLSDRWESEVKRLAELPPSPQKDHRDDELTRLFEDELVKMLHSLDLAGVPFLLVLDTFEIVQERQRGHQPVLFAFLRRLQDLHPALRVVISGRAAPEASGAPDSGNHEAIAVRVLELKGLDRATSASYLERAGLSGEHAREVAQHLVPDGAEDEGASPLSLRVAAEIWRRDQDRDALDTTFWAELQAGRIQAQLITRYLRHTDPASPAGQLALPSMLLTRIEPATLVEVVAPAWGVDVAGTDEDTLFDDLAELISLVLGGGGRALLPRPEVQRQVVDLLKDAEDAKVSRLYDLAVAHSARVSEVAAGDARHEARFDEVVYRLARGDDEATVRERWSSVCAAYVTGRVPLLSLQAQGLLEQLAGFELAPATRETASRQVWTGEAVIRARRALDSSDFSQVVAIAAEREDWDRASELSLLLARALVGLEQPLDALDVAGSALAAGSAELSSAQVVDLQLVAAEAAYQLDRPQEVLASLEDAVTIARERGDAPRSAQALLLRLVVEHERVMPGAADTADQLVNVLADDGVPLTELGLRRLMSVVDTYGVLLRPAVLAGALAYLSPDVLRQAARTVTAVDEEVSAERGQRPGVLATSVGLTVGSSVTRTWQDALAVNDARARQALVTALDQTVPVAGILRQELAKSLWHAADSVLRPPQTSYAVEHTVVLNARRRRDLVAALVSELSPGTLFDIAAEEFDISYGSRSLIDAPEAESVEGFVTSAETDGWLDRLVIAARNRQPGAPALFRVANELDLTSLHLAQGRFDRAVPQRDRDFVMTRLGTLEAQIGRIERSGMLVGTGLLVSPELLLTAGSATQPSAVDAGAWRITFGQKADAKRRTFDPGDAFALGPDALVDRIEIDEGAVLNLLRVDGYPGDEPIGRGRGEYFHVRRGFADVSMGRRLSSGQSAFVCWQQRARLELHVERRVEVPSSDGLLGLPSLGSTAVGAPCFDREMAFAGLVVSDTRAGARMVSGERVWQLLSERGHGRSVGVALA